MKEKCAVGLFYGSAMEVGDAPKVGVKGHNILADKIVRAAKKYRVPIIYNRPLARALSRVQLDSEIPEELFQAVAIILKELEGGTGR